MAKKKASPKAAKSKARPAKAKAVKSKPAKKPAKKPSKKPSKKPTKKPAKPAGKKAAKPAAGKIKKLKPATNAKAAKPATAVKKAAKGASKPAKTMSKKSKPAATSASAEPLIAKVTKLPAKGVLIRLKPTKESERAAEKAAQARSFTEKSNGSSPVTLHHRKPTKPEVTEFREKLVQRRAQLLKDVKGLEAEAFSDETQVVSTNHLADSSFEQYEQEFNLSMIENETEELKEIARALDKIEDGTFGVCESCGIDISIERLNVMPYTRICIHCRTRFEEEGTGHEFGVVPERRV